MVNLNKWEEVDFFDIKLDDKIKGYIETSPTLTEVVAGKVVYTHSTSDKLEGRIHLEKGGETHALIRDRLKGKQAGTSLYRRKALTQEELDAKFDLTEKLGTIVSGVHRADFVHDRPVYHVWDGGEWSTAHTSISSGEFREQFKNLTLVRKGVDIG